MNVKIRGRTYETGTGTSPPVYYKYGLVEFLGRGGSYVDTLYNGLYKWSTVHACSITVRVVNMSAEPLLIAIAPMPWSFTTGSPTLTEILDHPLCRRKTTGSSSGKDSIVLKHKATSAQVLGNDYQTVRYQLDSTTASNTTPISNDEPVWIVAVSSFNSSTAISYRVEVELDWDAKFYDLDSS